MGARAEALNGRWTSDWGQADLNFDGDAFTGKWSKGTLSGTVSEDGAMKLDWEHHDSTTGKASLQANDANDVIEGTWGFDGSDTDGGDWKLSLVKHVKSKDALEREAAEKQAAAEKKAADKQAAAEKKAADKKAAAEKKAAADEEKAAAKKAAADKAAADEKKADEGE